MFTSIKKVLLDCTNRPESDLEILDRLDEEEEKEADLQAVHIAELWDKETKLRGLIPDPQDKVQKKSEAHAKDRSVALADEGRIEMARWQSVQCG